MKKLYFITSNNGKMHEATMKLAPLGYELIQKDVGYPEIQTDSLEEVARFGIRYLKSKLDHPFILEDAGLFIDALGGFPGVYSSYVYHTIGLDGILALLKDVKKNKRTAVFRSVFAYGTSQGECELFIGKCPGIISTEKKGAKGFGYDPIFIPGKKAKTFAEMETKEKNNISHRGKSLDKLVQYLKI